MPSDRAESPEPAAVIASATSTLAGFGLRQAEDLLPQGYSGGDVTGVRLHAATVVRAWAALTPQQRAWYGWKYPYQVGNAEVPLEHKDYFLRLYLVRRLAELVGRIAASPKLIRRLDPRERRVLRNLLSTRAALRTAAAVRPGVRRPRCYVEEYDPEAFNGKGRAVVAVGDIDADTEAYLVAGIRVSEEKLGKYIRLVRNMFDVATTLEADRPLLLKTWIGWDAPTEPLTDLVPRIASPEAMRVGGHLLRRDLIAETARQARIRVGPGRCG